MTFLTLLHGGTSAPVGAVTITYGKGARKKRKKRRDEEDTQEIESPEPARFVDHDMRGLAGAVLGLEPIPPIEFMPPVPDADEMRQALVLDMERIQNAIAKQAKQKEYRRRTMVIAAMLEEFM